MVVSKPTEEKGTQVSRFPEETIQDAAQRKQEDARYTWDFRVSRQSPKVRQVRYLSSHKMWTDDQVTGSARERRSLHQGLPNLRLH